MTNLSRRQLKKKIANISAEIQSDKTTIKAQHLILNKKAASFKVLTVAFLGGLTAGYFLPFKKQHAQKITHSVATTVSATLRSMLQQFVTYTLISIFNSQQQSPPENKQ